MNDIEFYKKGDKIYIKKKNRGKFTDYCGGRVTDECIQKGKNSPDPKIRKRATFAANARIWKHQLGGIVKPLRPLLRKVLSVNKAPESYFNFNKNFYFAHATRPELLSTIMKTGYKPSAKTLTSSTIPVSSMKTYDDLLFRAVNKGEGLHHSNQGLVFLEIPKRKGQVRFKDDDIFEVLTPSETETFLKEGYLPTRFNLFAINGSRIF